MAMAIDVTGLSDYTPYEGFGASDLLTHDGKFHCQIAKAKVGKSTNTGKEMITLALVVKDDDNQGKGMIHNVVIGGVDKNGKPMIRGLGDLLLSIGHPIDAIRGMAAKKQIDVETLLKKNVEGKDCFVEAQAEVYEERATSKVRNLITKQQWEEAVAVKAHRKAHPFGNGAAPKAAGAGAPAAGAPAAGGDAGLGGDDLSAGL